MLIGPWKHTTYTDKLLTYSQIGWPKICTNIGFVSELYFNFELLYISLCNLLWNDLWLSATLFKMVVSIVVFCILILMELLSIVSHLEVMLEMYTSRYDLLETSWCWVKSVWFNFNIKSHTKSLVWLLRVLSRGDTLTLK